MAMECPVCHGPTAFAGRTPYCTRCDWQRKQAESQLRTSLKIAPIAFTLLLGFVLLFYFRSGARSQTPGLAALILLFPVVVFAFTYTRTRRNLNKLLAQPAPADPSAIGQLGAGTASELKQDASAEYTALLNTPAPRQVRIARRATMNLIMPMVIVAIFEAIILGHLGLVWARTHSFDTFETRDWVATALAVLLLFIPLSVWRNQMRERELLENGDVALGKVIKQWSVRNGASIVYEFTDATGEKRKQGGFDYTGKLYEGASVPVFYDRNDPKRQVAACSAFHEVVTPGFTGR